MYFAHMLDVQQAKIYGAVDETTEDDPVPRARDVVTQWIDTFNRPFISMKQLLNGEAVSAIRANLANHEWRESLHGFFREDVRAALEFVQASMDAKS